MRALVKSFRASDAAISLRQLKKLFISRDITYTSAQGHIRNIIELCADSLEDLIFVPGYCRFIDRQSVLQEYGEPIDLGRFSALRRVRFDIDIGPQPWVYTQSMDPQGRDTMEGWLDDLPNFSKLLCSLSAPCWLLEQMDIHCCFHVTSVHENEESWVKMADVLLGDLYPKLSQLNIGLTSRVRNEEGDAVLERFNDTLFVKKLRDDQKIDVRVFKHEGSGQKAELAEFPWPGWFRQALI
ncbi:hypothetical protein CPB83DRAFT_333135 [Crepidotus variabilis]|uniref:Uncharacterized protein n=1 Tax=Crepidotus variabilis TaxID=179855 RepID=A0A9P6ESL2_9AGAR|nr:hypothetical protein CPB83DRAFT_333135 [Crepidotus variabilis]